MTYRVQNGYGVPGPPASRFRRASTSLRVLPGFGATVASFVSALPWLVMMSRHRNWMFLISGLLTALNLIYSVAPKLRAQRGRMSPLLWISAVTYGNSAYLPGPMLQLLRTA